MAAGQFTPGPIHHFVIFRNQPQPIYLGTAVAAPESECEKFRIPIMNDLSGRNVPFQMVKDGEIWTITTTMNRFDYPIVRSLMALDGAGAPLGSETGYARGTFIFGVSDFQLILLNSYAGTLAAGLPLPGDLAVGRQFFTCNIRKYKESTVGTRVVEIAMILDCENLFIPGARGFQCYTENFSAAQLLALIQ